MDAFDEKSLTAISTLAGFVTVTLGVACVGVSGLVFEARDGFYITIASRAFRLPNAAMRGDFGTYKAEWAILGFSCIACGVLIVSAPRIRDQLHREVACLGLVLSFVAVVVFAWNVLS